MYCALLQVRFASRSRDDYGDHEVIPVVGSYELRSLSRSHVAAASAAASLHPSHRTSTDHMHAHMPGGVNAVYPPDLGAPDNLSLSSGAGGSLMARPHGVGSIGRGLGAISLARRASFGSSEAFGASAMSIAGSDDDTASQARAALPPLASLPRISRDGALRGPHWSSRRGWHECSGLACKLASAGSKCAAYGHACISEQRLLVS